MILNTRVAHHDPKPWVEHYPYKGERLRFQFNELPGGLLDYRPRNEYFIPASPILIALRKDWESVKQARPVFRQNFWRDAQSLEFIGDPEIIAHAIKVCKRMQFLQESES